MNLPKIDKTPEEVLESFRSAASRLARHVVAYEQGDRRGAVEDMANVLRLLLHDKKGTQASLLRQVGRRDILFFSTPNALKGTTASPQFPLVQFEASGFIGESLHADFEAVCWNFPGPGGPGDPDALYDVPAWNMLPCDEWWAEPIVVFESATFSRQELITTVAERLNGTHSDPSVAPHEAAVMRQETLPIEVTIGNRSIRPPRNLLYGCVRQVAYEVQKTLELGTRDLLDHATTVVPPRLSDPSALVTVRHDVVYQRRVLESFCEAGEGNTRLAEQLRAEIYWSA